MIYIEYPSDTPEKVKEIFEDLTKVFHTTTPKQRHILPRENFVKESKRLLKNSSLFVAEASQRSGGVELEAEWAHDMDVPIVLFVKEGKKYPKSLSEFYLRVIEYRDLKDLKDSLIDFLGTEVPSESKQEYFEYSDKKQYQSYKKGWERKYK